MHRHLQGRVAIVTGAGSGLGRAHALELARLGACVVVNDVAGAEVGSPGAGVVDEIRRRGGEAIADGGDVTDLAQMHALAARAVAEWGRIDILVNNAGVLRDRTFAKLEVEDFRRVLDVHLMGSVHATKAVWDLMREQRYGRIVMTTSSSGLYGNFGQSNYGAAKMALVGLMQTLGLEGASRNVRVNCLAPTAATAMTEGVLTPEALARLDPAAVSPALAALVGEDAPNRVVLLAGAGSVEAAHITMTRGIQLGELQHLPNGAAQVVARLDEIRDRTDEQVPTTGFEQCQFELGKAGFDMVLPSGG
ncbi:SDR family NAD(P)-dependent oxidoreductase [Pseudacidovorax intermedius]|uniref:SDR family NAD(P)-dependent oxidoreductase n=1 Tax=Pseudacidovorax intermedius TaxID=433924 RepID=UPI0026EF47A7|nr:SDR family NAD(P)-dependent oxidoreductase [Pseudacidovorax intermedius]